MPPQVTVEGYFKFEGTTPVQSPEVIFSLGSMPSEIDAAGRTITPAGSVMLYVAPSSYCTLPHGGFATNGCLIASVRELTGVGVFEGGNILTAYNINYLPDDQMSAAYSSLLDGRWHHVAIVVANTNSSTARSGLKKVTGIWIDGKYSGGSYLQDTAFSYSGSDYFNVGYDPYTGVSFEGQIEEVRVSKSVRYKPQTGTTRTGAAIGGAPFVPPTKPLRADGNTLVLLHFDGSFVDDRPKQKIYTSIISGSPTFVPSTIGQ